MMRQIQTPSQQTGPMRHETYTLGGLLAYAGIFPLLVVLLAAPALVLTFGLGAVTALALRRAYASLRAAQTADSTPAETNARQTGKGFTESGIDSTECAPTPSGQ